MEKKEFMNSFLAMDSKIFRKVIHRNDFELVKLLDSDMKRTNSKGETLLHLSSGACSAVCKLPTTVCRYPEVIQICLRKGADINAMTVDKKTPLLYAMEHGCLQVIKTLLEHGANFPQAHFSKYNPICLLCNKTSRPMFRDHVEVIRLLLSYKLDINQLLEDGNSLLHYAIMHKNWKIIGTLLENKADVSLKNIQGETAFHKIATTFSRKTKGIIEMLLRCNADINAVDLDGRIPFHLACEIGNEKIIKVFLDNGADINRKDAKGLTPIFYAPRPAVMRFLIENNADNTCVTKEGKTLLHYLVRFSFANETDRIDSIINYNINIRDNKGKTALHDAIEELSEWGIENLLDFAPDINLLDNDNHDAFYSILNRLFDLKNKTIHEDWKPPRNIDRYWDVNVAFDVAQVLVHYMTKYIIKLECIGIFIDNATYQLLIDNLVEHMGHMNVSDDFYFDVVDFRSQCNEEVKRLKDKFIGESNISFYDLLTKNVHSLVKHADNKDMKRYLEDEDSIQNFPLYFTMMKYRFAESVRRRELIGMIPMQTLLDVFPRLPGEIVDVIISYLDYDDLKKFIGVLQNKFVK